jgi:hypothetical protein
MHLASRPCRRVAGDFLISNAGIYAPTRLIQGSTDAGVYFQGATQPLLLEQAALRHLLLQWLADFLVHSETED